MDSIEHSVNSENNFLQPHHVKSTVCSSRATYRDSRREKAVKVYTINLESYYLLIQNVPLLDVSDDLRHLCEQYGVLEQFELLKDFPREDFTEVYLVKYQWFPAARTAKRQLDEKSFFGALLHVCYAPEYETLSDTRQKLGERRKYVASRRQTRGKNSCTVKRDLKDMSSIKTNIATQASIFTNNATESELSVQPTTYIWAGKEYTIPPPQQSGTSGADRQCQSNSSSNSNKSSSILTTTLKINKRISKLNVPNARVSFKRRKRI